METNKTRYYFVEVNCADANYGGIYSVGRAKDIAEDYKVFFELDDDCFDENGKILEDIEEITVDIIGYRNGTKLYEETCEMEACWLSANSMFFENPEDYEVSEEEYDNLLTEALDEETGDCEDDMDDEDFYEDEEYF